MADADTSFDEEPVHTATPKTAAKAPAKQPAEKQRPVASSKITPMRSKVSQSESGFDMGGWCDQTCFHGGHSREIADTLRQPNCNSESEGWM